MSFNRLLLLARARQRCSRRPSQRAPKWRGKHWAFVLLEEERHSTYPTSTSGALVCCVPRQTLCPYMTSCRMSVCNNRKFRRWNIIAWVFFVVHPMHAVVSCARREIKGWIPAVALCGVKPHLGDRLIPVLRSCQSTVTWQALSSRTVHRGACVSNVLIRIPSRRMYVFS